MKPQKVKKLANYLKDPQLTVFDELNEINDNLEKAAEIFSAVEQLKGETGPQGEQGEKGDTGEMGPTGPQGEAGQDGKSGKRGKDGIDGNDGKNGKDGSPDTPKEIVAKISSLVDEDRLSYEVLKDRPDLDKIIERLNSSRKLSIKALKDLPIYPSSRNQDQRYHGSGVTKIIAGNGINITQTDSISGLGDVTINTGNGGAPSVSTIFYVNGTTGNDANNGTTALTAFKTIQKSFNKISAGIFPGVIGILVADGTYTEQLVTPQILGGSPSSATSPSSVVMIGNTTTPGNVIIQGSGGTIFRHIFNPVTFTLTGFTLQNNGLGRGLEVNGSYLRYGAVNISNCQIGINSFNNAIIEMISTVQGRNIDASLYNLNLLQSGSITSVNKITLTGATIYPVQIAYSSLLWPYGGIDITGVLGVTTTGIYALSDSFCQIQGDSVFKDLNGIGGSAALIAVSRSIIWLYNAAMNITFDNCTNSIQAGQISVIYSAINTGVGSFNYLNGTPKVVQLDPSSFAQSYDAGFFGGCTVQFVLTASGIKLGGDYRYAELVKGQQTGALPVGANVYFGFAGTQANYIPLHIAQDAELVVKLQIVSRVGNGVGHTDTYTLYKNGVATAMTISVTNSTGASTVANQISLAIGDTIGIFVATDAATVAADVLVLAKVIKQ